ncbi:MAG: nitrogen regulatory protein PII [Flavobacterium sp.]|jgi:nitrogen regulatory protein PII
MKLLIITAIKEFEKEIKQQLKTAKVCTFSYKNVIGYRDNTEDAIESNWFSSEMNKSESILFYAFVKKENVDMLFESINEFNAKQETLSKIHVAVLAIEKSN